METPFNTGDIYLEERYSAEGLLQKAHEVEAQWNGIGVCINEESFKGILIARDSHILFMTMQDVSEDIAIMNAGIRQLNRRCTKKHRMNMGYYFERNFTDKETVADIVVTNRVMQRATKSWHPKIQSPTYAYTRDGRRVTEKGRTITIPGYGVGNGEFTPIKSLTMFSLVSAVLASAGIQNLFYDPEFQLSIYNDGGFMEGFLKPTPTVLRFGYERNGNDAPFEVSRLNDSISKTASIEGSKLVSLYFESYFFSPGSDEYDDNRRAFLANQNTDVDEEYDPYGMNMPDSSFQRRTRQEIQEDALDILSSKNRERAQKNAKIREAQRHEPISYK